MWSVYKDHDGTDPTRSADVWNLALSRRLRFVDGLTTGDALHRTAVRLVRLWLRKTASWATCWSHCEVGGR